MMTMSQYIELRTYLKYDDDIKNWELVQASFNADKKNPKGNATILREIINDYAMRLNKD